MNRPSPSVVDLKSVGDAPLSRLAVQHARVAETLEGQPLSLARVLLSLVSYALLLTDTMRTGFAVRHLENFTPFETDTVLNFGPFAYPVSTTSFSTNSTTAQATATSGEPHVPFWPYKYDSTSIVMRALVQHLGVRGWPACVLYRERCDERSGVAPATVFTMLDALIDAVKRHKPAFKPSGRVGQLTIRTTSVWVDRLTDRVLPWFFLRVPQRTGRAIVFDVARDTRRQLCGRELPHPLFCRDLWTRLPRPTSGDAASRQRDPWYEMAARARTFQASRPTPSKTTITHAEALFLEGVDDFSRGGLLFQGHRNYEIVLLTRLRECSRAGVCETVAIDDFRFESGVVVAGVTHWANMLTVLRGVAQSYLWLRFLGLLLGAATAASPSLPRRQRWRVVLKTVCLVPSQVVVYGSALPIACYAVAHVLDALMMQEFMYGHLNTIQGLYQLKLTKILEIGAVALRSVWLVALGCHAASWLWRARPGSPVGRVGGVPEFVITALASATVLAQMRVKSWRDSRVLSVTEVPRHAGHAALQASLATRGFTIWDHALVGAKIDAQFVVVAGLAIVALAATLATVRRLSRRRSPLRVHLLTHSDVPFSAGPLWSTNMLVVSWFGSILSVDRPVAMEPASDSGRIVSSKTASALRRLSSLFIGETSKAGNSSRLSNDDNLPLRDLQSRSSRAEALIFLMNLTMMTDPVTWLRLRWQDGVLLGVYRSQSTTRLFLLPMGMTMHVDELSRDLELETIVRSSEVTWWQLLLTG
ncbi:hypothetical protein ATCC90586_001839 [Pythium insidiosum]|nr:hypothetical protein ATCC90586_001839 [Pythium insidiosum]